MYGFTYCRGCTEDLSLATGLGERVATDVEEISFPTARTARNCRLYFNYGSADAGARGQVRVK